MSDESLPSPSKLMATMASMTERMAQLEERLQQTSMDTSPPQDQFVVEHSPETELSTYPEFHQAMPGFQQDFFRSLLPEVERRRFLADCPRNVDRDYTPPPVNTINLDQSAKRYDTQLSDIQFRLSGITRPLDFFLHKIIQAGSVQIHEAIEFVNVVHTLLADSASHITQLRIENMFRGAGIQGQVPKLVDSAPPPLLDPKELLEQINLNKSVAQVGRPSGSRRRKGKAHSLPTPTPSDKSKSDPQVSNPSKPWDSRKGFHQGSHARDREKRPENRQ
jgi:hypothetical protein